MSDRRTERIYHGRTLEPYRIGVLVDLPGYPVLGDAFPDGVRFALDEAVGRGVVERPVETVFRGVRAQPWTDARPLLSAYRELVEDEGVLGVAGPFTSDNALALLPLVEQYGVPTISMCGSPLFVGNAAFNLANGGLADEPPVIAAWLQGQGYRNVALLRETTQIGEEYTAFFRRAAADLGITIRGEAPVYTVVSEVELVDHLIRLRESKPDALVYLGLGGLNQVMRSALESIGWDPPRIQTTGFVGATYNEDKARLLDGWVGVDQYDERNEVFAAVLDRFEKAYGYRPANSALSCAYDMGHALAVGLGRMRIATPASLILGLETVRRLPACTGGPGTVITFGPQDHRGFKGCDVLVIRRATGGKTEFVGTAPVAPWEQV
jgi:ABC-type branched-subunit amino acid transport system substrate-binding protein